MNAKWPFLVILPMMAAVAFCGAVEQSSAENDSVAGRVEARTQEGELVWVELEIEAAQNSQDDLGELRISADGNSIDTLVEVAYLVVEDDYAWMAGECSRDTGANRGKWLFVVVHDGGRPGHLVDHLWIEWLGKGPKGQADAKERVQNIDKPADNQPIESGDIQVRDVAS
jgi:hypothetical protein